MKKRNKCSWVHFAFQGSNYYMFKRNTDYKSRTGKSSDHCRHFMFFEKKNEMSSRIQDADVYQTMHEQIVVL